MGEARSVVEELRGAISGTEIVRLTQELVRIDSVTGAEAKVMRRVQTWLAEHDCAANVIGREDARPNLVTHVGVEAGPLLAFNGHLDTVPIGSLEEWKEDPLGGVVRNGRLYGRGSFDMKGPCAVMMHVVALLRRAGSRFRGRVQLQLVADEEKSSHYGTRFLLEEMTAGRLPRPDAVLIGEKSNLKLRLADRGSFPFRIRFRGRSSHTAMARVSGVNPIAHAAAAIPLLEARLERFHAAVGYPIRSVNAIQAGVVSNQVPAECTLTVDRRLVPGETKESVLKEVDEILAGIKRSIPELDWHIIPFPRPDGQDEFSPPNLTPDDHPFAASVRDAFRRVTGHTPATFVDWGGGTDARIFREHAVPAIVLGPTGDGHHGADEYVDVDALVQLAHIYLELAVGMAADSRG
jgi:acetylornithine deacetylase/succinyl-diaminopimelate desuccinylase family protein